MAKTARMIAQTQATDNKATSPPEPPKAPAGVSYNFGRKVVIGSLPSTNPNPLPSKLSVDELRKIVTGGDDSGEG